MSTRMTSLGASFCTLLPIPNAYRPVMLCPPRHRHLSAGNAKIASPVTESLSETFASYK